MKKYFQIAFIVTILAVFIDGCSKKNLFGYVQSGTGVSLTSSSTTITPGVSDSNKTVLTLNWTNPGYASDSTTFKYIVEIDTTGRNFAKEVTTTIIGKSSISFTGNQINSLLGSLGYLPGKSYKLDIRVTSSYSNNNNQLRSNVLTVSVTPFFVPINLTPSSTSPIVLLVSNATSPAVGFNWNASTYGADTINYALQFDTVGGNFANPQIIKYGSSLTSSITVNDLNNAAIASGVSGGSTKNVEFRVVSYLGTSYTTPLVYSNIVNLSVTTFTPVPPALYIVGDATVGGWSNPVPIPSQQFTRLDAVSYGIVVNLTAGKSYLFLPVNGDWGHKYGGTSATGGTLLTDGAVPGSNTPAPSTTGTYQIIVNFQTGTYTVTPVTTTIPSNLFIVGDATDGGWSNPVPVPSQQFTQIDASSFGIIVNMTAGKSYLFLPVNGDWGHKFGGTSATGGTLLADGAVPGSNTPAPSTSGLYQIIVNFVTGTYSVTPFTGVTPVPTNLFIVGDATAGAWNNPVPVPSQQFTRVSLTDFQITVPLTTGKSYLFLPVNGDWGHKYGGSSATGGTILVDGAVPSSNTPAPAVSGNYLIDVNFATGTYTLTKQ